MGYSVVDETVDDASPFLDWLQLVPHCVGALLKEEATRSTREAGRPEVTQVLCDGHGKGCFENTSSDEAELRSTPWLDDLLGGAPQVFHSLEAVVIVDDQQPMLTAMHEAQGIGYVLHDEKPLEDDPGGGQRGNFASGLDSGLSHVHLESLDACELFRGAGLVDRRQARLLTALCQEPDRAPINVIDDGQVPMALAKRFPIATDAGTRVGLLRAEAAGHASLEDVPRLNPGAADARAGALHGLAGPTDIDPKPIDAQREAGGLPCARRLYLRKSVPRAHAAWDARMGEGVEIAGVEVPPLPLGGVVLAGQFTATVRACPAAAIRMLVVAVDLCCPSVESHVCHLPRRG